MVNVQTPSILGSLRLDKLFSKLSQVKLYTIATGDQTIVPDGKVWIILGGYIVHTTGTATQIIAYLGSLTTGKIAFYNGVDTAQASGQYPFFNTIAGIVTGVVAGAQWTPQILPAGMILAVSGGAGCTVNMIVLETDAF